MSAYAPNPGDADGLFTRAREVVWIGDPVRTGTSHTNPRAADPQILATQHFGHSSGSGPAGERRLPSVPGPGVWGRVPPVVLPRHSGPPGA